MQPHLDARRRLVVANAEHPTIRLNSGPRAPPGDKRARERGVDEIDRHSIVQGGIDKVLLAIGSNTDEGHYAAFILDRDGNNIEAAYRIEDRINRCQRHIPLVSKVRGPLTVCP